ncbi:organic hydroperoxide resistance protein [Pedobacter sp.]|uniref:organic hydroperoxide resistance protein n=1 Tax=Pedobacter sp. TaxID=1411316 RepID=UPI003BAC0F3C
METTNNPQTAKVLYTGKTVTTGGREGASKSSDGRLDIKLTSPGASGAGTNPEQLFAAGWSACFIGAMGFAAAGLKLKLPVDTSVNAEVDLCLLDGQYSLQARLSISLPGIDKETAKQIAEIAHGTCPYSKATKGNIKVETIIL